LCPLTPLQGGACGALAGQMENKLPLSCPVCGRKKEYLVTELVEGAILTCPFCKLTITLHGHMWQDVQKEIKKLREKT